MTAAGQTRLSMTPLHPDSPALPLAASRSGLRGEVLMLIGLVAVAAIPVWAFHYFPTTDGGAHVANADVLLQYFRPSGNGYRAYYELNRLPVPNWAGHFV